MLAIAQIVRDEEPVAVAVGLDWSDRGPYLVPDGYLTMDGTHAELIAADLADRILPYCTNLTEDNEAVWGPHTITEPDGQVCYLKIPEVLDAVTSDSVPGQPSAARPDAGTAQSSPDPPGGLYKTVAVIWSRYSGDKTELSSLAFQAETGDAYCSAYWSELVRVPDADPDWDGTDFFGHDPGGVLLQCGGGCQSATEETPAHVTVDHNVAADDAGRHLGFDGYQEGQPVVPVFAYDAHLHDDGMPELLRIAEAAFEAFNADLDMLAGIQRELATRYRDRRLRSLSVGDIVCVGEVALAVGRPAGWEPASGPLAEVRTREHGTSPLPLPGRAPGSGPHLTPPDPRKENHGE
jgi:hypothetical protein